MGGAKPLAPTNTNSSLDETRSIPTGVKPLGAQPGDVLLEMCARRRERRAGTGRPGGAGRAGGSHCGGQAAGPEEETGGAPVADDACGEAEGWFGAARLAAQSAPIDEAMHIHLLARRWLHGLHSRTRAPGSVATDVDQRPTTT